MPSLFGAKHPHREVDSSSWYPDVTFDPGSKIAQIDLDPSELGRNYPLAIGAVADPKQTLRAILEDANGLTPGA